jgi:hypothetical protein
MSIKSHAFGRVTLTGKDAEKFEAQVRYGRVKPAAVESAKRGSEMVRQLQKEGGSVTVRMAPAKS